MRITASINVSKDNIKWSKLATHNQRKTANHSNQNINDNMSKYNGYYQLMDYYKLNLKMIKQSNAKNHWLDARNKKYKSRGQYKYVETPQELAKKATKKGQNSRNIVVQLGNTQSKKKLINRLRKQKLSKSEQAKVINKTFRDYAEKFNRTHLHNGHGLAITDLDVHNDEKTIHAHGRLVSFYQAKDKHKPAHYTKSGNFKPAKVKKGALKFGFSRGVKAEYGGSTPRVAFKRFRSYEDNQIVRSFSRSLNQSLELTRTGGITNYTRQEQSMAASYQDQAHSLVSSSIHDFSISMTNREVKDSKAESAISSDRQAVNEQVAKQNQQTKLFKQYKINRINQLKKIKKQIKQEKQNYKDWHVKETREQRILKQQQQQSKKLTIKIRNGHAELKNIHAEARKEWNKEIKNKLTDAIQAIKETSRKYAKAPYSERKEQTSNVSHGLIGKFKHFASKVKTTYSAYKRNQSNRAVRNSLNRSIAEPIQEKHDRFMSLSSHYKSKYALGTPINERSKSAYYADPANAPETSYEFIKSASTKGINLIKSSKAKSASESKAEPSIKASKARSYKSMRKAEDKSADKQATINSKTRDRLNAPTISPSSSTITMSSAVNYQVHHGGSGIGGR